MVDKLTEELGRPVAVEAYAMQNSRIVEKYLDDLPCSANKAGCNHHQSQLLGLHQLLGLDAGLRKFSGWPDVQGPMVIFVDLKLWPFLHPEEVAWAGATLLMPALRYRYELEFGYPEILFSDSIR